MEQGGINTGGHYDAPGEEPVDVELEVPAAQAERRLRELDEQIWKYLGSLPAQDEVPRFEERQISIASGCAQPAEQREQVAHFEDSDERAVANIGGGAPNRWGRGDAYHAEMMAKKGFSWDAPGSSQKNHPLYASMCLLAMREVINTR